MDIKDLNKPQIILLALLISFIASVATSIVTASLLQAAPTNVTRTINRVIENTIEKVIPGDGSHTVQTIVVKEDDLIIDALDQYLAAKVNISVVSDTPADPIASGFVVGTDKRIIADGRKIDETKKYTILSGKEVIPIEFIQKANGMALFKQAATQIKNSSASLTLFDPKNLKIGQTLVFYSNSQSKVLKSIASSFSETNTGITEGTASYRQINLADLVSSDFVSSPALTLDGEIAGIVLETPDGAVLFDANVITDLLKPVEAPKI